MRAVEADNHLAVKIYHRYAELAGFFNQLLGAAGNFVNLYFFIGNLQAAQVLLGRVAKAASAR